DAAAGPFALHAQAAVSFAAQAGGRDVADALGPLELRGVVELPGRAARRRQLQLGERALPALPASRQLRAQRERTRAALRVGIECQLLDAAARIRAQVFEGQAERERTAFDVQRASGTRTAPRQLAARDQAAGAPAL